MTEVVLLAGGTGSRMGDAVADKILTPIAGESAFRRCLDAFGLAGLAQRVIVVTRNSEQRQALIAEAGDLAPALCFVDGGNERRKSVHNGLAATRPGTHLVFIHDCARALIHPESLRLVQRAAAQDGAAVLAHPVIDTIKRLPAPRPLRGVHPEDLERDRLWAMETPQVFRRDWIHHAYERHAGTATDDVAVATAAGFPVTVVPNPHPNPKITRPEDLDFCEWLLSRRPSLFS